MKLLDRIVDAMWRWRMRGASCPNPMCRLPLLRVEVTLGEDGTPVEFKGECPQHGWMVASSK